MKENCVQGKLYLVWLTNQNYILLHKSWGTEIRINDIPEREEGEKGAEFSLFKEIIAENIPNL